MRLYLLAFVPALLCGMTACQDDDAPWAASPAVTTPAAPARSLRTTALAGPHTRCGELQPPGNGPMAVIAVEKGHADCRVAMTVFRAYYRPDTPKQGSAGIATVRGWTCAGNSAAQANITGRLSSCRTSTTTIVADIIP